MILSDEDVIRKGQAMFEFSPPLVASSGTGRGNLQKLTTATLTNIIYMPMQNHN